MSESLAFYILAAVLGALLMWLLKGNDKKRIKQLEDKANKDRLAMNDLVTEFKLFQTNAASQLRLKDKELSKIKKSKAFPDIIANAQEKEITHWKNKARELEKRISKESNKSNGSNLAPKNTEELKKLKEKLSATQKKLAEKEQILDNMENATEESFVKNKTEIEFSKKKIAKLKKELKALKKKLKAKPKKEKETIEIKETLDLTKLSKLLKQGKLTKKSKKVLKKKKSKKKGKKVASKKAVAQAGTASESPRAKSILDVIPELKLNS